MYKKNQSLDDYLRVLTDVLRPAEDRLLDDLVACESGLPTVIKIGSPRVGGTLLTQWASSGNLFYNPTNLHSRFYAVPIVGAIINKLIGDPSLDYRDEFSDVCRELSFDSSIGKTAGLLAPHEFWYFWRHFLHISDVPELNGMFLEKSDFSGFGKSLKAIQRVEGKSLFLKGHLVNFQLEAFDSKMSDMIYFHLKRSILDTARSLYKARIEWTGSADNWFSHKPPEYTRLKDLDPCYQVVGQIYFIEREMQRVAPLLGDRYLSVNYVDFCSQPSEVYVQLAERMNSLAHDQVQPHYDGPQGFIASKKSDRLLDVKLQEALSYFIKEYGEVDTYEAV